MPLNLSDILLDSQTSDPLSPVDGQVWFNSTDGRLKARVSGSTYVLSFSPHGADHEDGGVDELTAQNLGSGAEVAGQLLETDGTGGWSLISRASAGFQTGMSFVLTNDPSHPYMEIGGSSWEVAAAFRFPGTDIFTPTAVKAVVESANTGYSFDVRLFDSTNALVVATKTAIVANTVAVVDFGSVSNLPSGEAVFEVQGQKNSNQGRIYSLHLV